MVGWGLGLPPISVVLFLPERLLCNHDLALSLINRTRHTMNLAVVVPCRYNSLSNIVAVGLAVYGVASCRRFGLSHEFAVSFESSDAALVSLFMIITLFLSKPCTTLLSILVFV